MIRWQYTCLKLAMPELAEGYEAKLNELGAEGWEVVAVVPGERHGYSHDATFVLKRPAEGS